jgi:hypothetical protein
LVPEWWQQQTRRQALARSLKTELEAAACLLVQLFKVRA